MVHSENTLFEMIERVIQAPDERQAIRFLLQHWLSLFDMDQAALCELSAGDDLSVLLGIDFTHKLLRQEEVWISKTALQQAFQSMETQVHLDSLEDENGDLLSKSIRRNSLQSIVCVPLQSNPKRLIYLASKRKIPTQFSTAELAQFKTAAKAAWLALKHHHQLQTLKEDHLKLQSLLQQKNSSLLYQSEPMVKVLSEVERLAPFNVSVFLEGESGVGKEEIAKEIHRLSKRDGPFIAVNCANLSETLLESELFGYVKGAFTGAVTAKRGLFQEAEGGTFFLDEVTEIPHSLQAKLLRVLQERMVRPIGATQEIPINVRVLAASHVSLERAVFDKKFREDLMYRIQEIVVQIPPLRNRKDDIELLARHFIDRSAQEFKLPARELTPDALSKLQSYVWPGNVRELKNICRSATILSRSSQIQQDDIRLPPVKPEKPNEKLQEKLKNQELSLVPPIEEARENMLVKTGPLRDRTRGFERDTILSLLKNPGETQSSVAQKLEISVRTLQRILNGSAEASDLSH